MKAILTISFAAVAAISTLGEARAVTFSLGPPTVPPGTPAPVDDILLAPLPGPPLYPGGSAFDVNGFSYGYAPGAPVGGFAFSVDAGTVGAPASAVFAESGGGLAVGEQSAGVYVSVLAGTNGHLHDGDGAVFGVPSVGAPAALGLVEAAGGPLGTPFDDVDGLDLRPGSPGGAIYWTPSLATAGALAADGIYVGPAGAGYPGASGPWAAAAALGLGAVMDDIDALVVFDDAAPGFSPGDFVYYSLAPGSGSLPLIAGGVGPEDIIGVAFGGAPFVVVPGGTGLIPGDNLNALDIIIPEPATFPLIALACFGLALRRRR